MNTITPSDRPALALIAGPTASGKSAVALRLAEECGGTVINADASQVYADLRILSARPSEEEEARVPHKLYGYLDAGEACTAPRWAADARAAIEAAHRAGSLPILVGGTGLYIRTLLDGIAPIPVIDEAVRAAVRALSVADAHSALCREDPEAAARLRASDTTRVARALEVVRATGRPISAWQAERRGGIAGNVRLCPLVLLPPRPWLHGRCDARFAGMVDCGAVDEVRALLARGLDPALPAMRAIGVREIAGWLDGGYDRAEAVMLGQRATRQYVKRQFTWLAHQLPASWPTLCDLDNASAAERATKLLNTCLTR